MPSPLSRLSFTALFLLSVIAAGGARAENNAALGPFDVRVYGAAGDGKTLDHPAINRAIAAARDAGGGTVRLPAGNYLCFSVHLQSNVTLQFESGATIIAADPAKDGGRYDPPEPNEPADLYEDFGHSHWRNSLLWGENLENVAIVGPGLIHGRGLSKGDTGRADEPGAPARDFSGQPFDYPNARDTLRDGIGNKSIALKNCRNVALRDFSVRHGGHFAILATGVDNLDISHLKIDTNRDGMDIDACRNVRVTDCSVNSPWDDAICLKSSYGLGSVRATDNVTISGCYVAGSFREGALLDATWRRFGPEERISRNGRIKFGTESNGGFRRVTITNCVFEGCQGLAIESVDGGVIEDVTVSNLPMRDIVSAPIFIRLGSRLRGPETPPVGAIRRVVISNVTYSGANGRYDSILSGVPGHPLEDILISNVQGEHEGGGSEEDARRQPPENADKYPEPGMFGAMPSWGLYARHCVELKVRDVGMRLAKPDRRPCVVLDDVTDAEFDGLKTSPRGPSADQVFVLRNVRNFTRRACTGLADVVDDVKAGGQ